MLYVTTWHWGDKFSKDHANILHASVKRNLKQPFEWRVFTPEQEDEYLTKVPGCFCRLRQFDPIWQKKQGIKSGDKIVCIDLDTVITGSLDELFDRDEPFVIMQGANASNPCPFNGALMMLCAGTHPEVWSDFSIEAANKISFHSFPDDQGWIWHKVPDAAGWKVGKEHRVYVYKKPGWPSYIGDALPKGARLVTFINNDPSKLVHLDWVKEHWHD